MVYNRNQPDITVFFRKYLHNFQGTIDFESKEAVCAKNLVRESCYLVSDDDYINSFCSLCFAKLNKTTLPLQESDTDDKTEILTLKVSRDQQLFAVIAGKNMIKGEEELRQILVYQIISKNEFKMIVNHILDEKYYSYSKNFDFCYRDDNPEGDGNALLILSRQEILRFDFNKPKDNFTLVYRFENELQDQPDFASFNEK